MSGEKDTYVNLRNSEYQRMMKACRRIDDVETNVNQQIQNASQNLWQDMNAQLNKVNNRYDNFQNALHGMSSDMKHMETNFNSGLRNMSEQFQKDLSGLDNRLQNKIDRQKHELLNLIRSMGERFDNALEQQRHVLQDQINSINLSLAKEKKDKRFRAEQWFNDTQLLINAIGTAYRHEKFQPGELAKIQNELAIAKNNIQNADYESAISASQQTYLRAKTLQMTLEHLENQWNIQLDTAKFRAVELIALCDAHTLAEFAIDTVEGSQKIKAEIDFWTEGKLNDLKQQAVSEKNRLEKPDNLSSDDLKKSIAKTEQSQKIVELLCEQAKQALIASQLRNNIGQSIETALLEAGWEIKDATYQGEDYRKAMHIKLQNLAGDELLTIISPEQTEQQTIRNKVNISFFDRSTNDEQNRLNRLKKITDLLNHEHLECSQPSCVPGTENKPSINEAKLDFSKVRKQTAKG